MAYQKQDWKDLPDRSTPISAERLNHMEDGIENSVDLNSTQTISGSKTFSSNITINSTPTSNNHALRLGDIEYKSNSNGSYIKFPNGLLICLKKVDFKQTIQTQWGSLYENAAAFSLGDWPMKFNSIPTTSVNVLCGGSVFLQGHQSVTESSAGTIRLTRATISTDLTGTICVIGFGNWK